MKFAIIETGGKQYKVAEGDTVSVERIPGVAEGGEVTFDKVLLIDDGSATKVGMPHLAGATVTGSVEKEGRAPKISVVKYKAKSRYFKRRGHRQPFLSVKISKIS